jgi:NAD(P)H-dependent flavin oxidoreductase YrpB (nitropropane dioxygenase family)
MPGESEWPDGRIIGLIGIALPIIQAPMAGAGLGALAIAVSEAGGLGSLPCAMLSGVQARAELTNIRRSTTRPIQVNFFCHRPARGFVNRAVRDIGPMSDLAPEFPLAATAMAPLRASAAARGSSDFSPMWAGQSAALARQAGAGELTRHLAGEALERLRWLGAQR